MATKKAAGKGAAKKGLSDVQKAEIGAGALLAAAAAGAAGYYFYGAKSATKHRAATAKWAQGLKSDVVREAKKLKDLDEKAMKAIVDQAAKAYKGLDDVTPGDLRGAVAELKGNWENVRKEVRSTGRAAAKGAKGSVKKAAPKAAKKAPAKKRSA
jgi:uncharacterized protein HemX